MLPLLQVAIEFTTASVTAPGVDMLAEKLPGDFEQLLNVAETGLHISNQQSMHYSNIRKRGKAQIAQRRGAQLAAGSCPLDACTMSQEVAAAFTCGATG